MKRFLALLAVAALATSVSAGELKWLTSMDEALAKAKKENKLVLMDFTGSDWCFFCIKLEKEVFSTREFQEYAAKNLVLLKLDFPRKKKLPAEQEKANRALMEKYKVRGFPTLVILSPEGKELDRKVGYGGGGPDSLIKLLDKHRPDAS
ncbi:MAG: thioredoxin family protein [Verrucomicrobia bacterium]|nr:MAG: thioredoxin family protein [Verrucomicrobiota bacterium]